MKWQANREYQRVLGIQNGEAEGILVVPMKRKALERWYLRVKRTLRFRARWEQYHRNYEERMKRKVWEVFQFK